MDKNNNRPQFICKITHVGGGVCWPNEASLTMLVEANDRYLWSLSTFAFVWSHHFKKCKLLKKDFSKCETVDLINSKYKQSWEHFWGQWIRI